ncbi:pre-rRNA processing and 40S ribosomal subunit assembly [Microsporum ferrugineum]
MLGKRKRDVTVASRDRATVDKDESTHDISSQDAQERLRKYFESRFEPLDLPVSNPGGVQDGSSDAPDTDISDEDDWDGIEDGEEEEDCEPAPEVVDYSTAPIQRTEVIDKATARKYMSSKPPSLLSDSTKPTKKQTKKGGEEATDDQTTDAANLKNDLALQRLLKESHLLDSASDLNPTGVNRHKAIDLRAQTAGAKTSIYTQKSMPMSHRKGISAKATQKEAIRRREAQENGIILERPSLAKSKLAVKRRDRGIGGPSVGKFVGGTLKLSRQDVMAIQGPKAKTRKKGAKSSRNGKERRH